MRSDPEPAFPPQPRVFHYSLDWRFLLPISDPGKIRVVSEERADFNQTLEQAGIPVADQLSFSDLRQDERNNIQSLVIPFGLPVRWVGEEQEDQIEFYRSMRRLICPDGYLLVGFENGWKFRSGNQSKYHSSTPRRITYRLHKAGFKSIKIFGAIPNLCIPEYIFDMNTQATRFVLHHRFRRKPIMLNVMQLLSRTIGWTRISTFLPCYFAVAAV